MLTAYEMVRNNRQKSSASESSNVTLEKALDKDSCTLGSIPGPVNIL